MFDDALRLQVECLKRDSPWLCFQQNSQATTTGSAFVGVGKKVYKG